MTGPLIAFDVDVTIVDTADDARPRSTRLLSVLAVDQDRAEIAGHRIGAGLAEASGYRWKLASDGAVVVKPSGTVAQVPNVPAVVDESPRCPLHGVHGVFGCPWCQQAWAAVEPATAPVGPPIPDLTAVILAMAEVVLLSADPRDRLARPAIERLRAELEALDQPTYAHEPWCNADHVAGPDMCPPARQRCACLGICQSSDVRCPARGGIE